MLRSLVHQLIAPLAVVALSLDGYATPPSLGGSAVGRYHAASARATLLDGRVADERGVARFAMEASLLGAHDAGALIGTMRELPTSAGGIDNLWQLEYDLVGGYSRDIHGVVRFEAQIFLVVPHQGSSLTIHVGEMQGLLDTPIVDRIQVAGGKCGGALPAPKLRVDELEPMLAAGAEELAARAKALEPVQKVPAKPATIQGTFRARYVLFG
jgi:hypothetical protein